MGNYKNVHVLAKSQYLTSLHTKARNRNAAQSEFVFYSDRIIRLLLEAASELLPYTSHHIQTPIGDIYNGTVLNTKLCGVSVIRAGESIEGEYRKMYPDSPVGKILIQRDKLTKLPHYYYSNLPDDIAERTILLFEPMLATGGSLAKAIDLLKEKGVPEDNIIVVNFLSSPVGLNRIMTSYPKIQLVTSSIENGLNEDAFMNPGIGDFGDRYFGTYKPS
ncbi:uracil phosphoribosyltransferase [Photorhabdus luminescens]|uniref:uracil phosphoribosyltransferase n=1 Tax=Photorhabdus luminescens TaxID=29488 RepID=UPI002240AC85|nr:uracil phosphoribosyltransferase [Photorhabdus luminescens]MCW7762892.1 uracil phosphoribosyltransferase [Photorhabdus luminescens subsp. venezuelensis]